MKTYGEWRYRLQTTSPLHHYICREGTQWIRGSVGPTGGLGAAEIENSLPLLRIELRLKECQARA
jgi:hypothetical protein